MTIKPESIESIASEMGDEIRDWLNENKSKDGPLSIASRQLLARCETIRTDFGPVEPSGMRKGPATPASLIDLGYQFCLWRARVSEATTDDN